MERIGISLESASLSGISAMELLSKLFKSDLTNLGSSAVTLI